MKENEVIITANDSSYSHVIYLPSHNLKETKYVDESQKNPPFRLLL